MSDDHMELEALLASASPAVDASFRGRLLFEAGRTQGLQQRRRSVLLSSALSSVATGLLVAFVSNVGLLSPSIPDSSMIANESHSPAPLPIVVPKVPPESESKFVSQVEPNDANILRPISRRFDFVVNRSETRNVSSSGAPRDTKSNVGSPELLRPTSPRAWDF